ncbi:hypothetical protein AB0B66_42725 [Catellatospora sp. NPDC049111]|uniref:hypothetical protein n=1 Tax=Catellatospora sp. NPDC049111 TaxID=3155271 RepID=UPI0033C5F7D3
MDLSAANKPLDGMISGRFFLIGYLPTYAAAVFVLILVWAGAPTWLHDGHALSFARAWQTARGLGVGEIVILTVAVTVIAVLFAPLQLAMMRVLEGNWPTALGAGVGRWIQRRRKRRMAAAAELPIGRSQLTADLVQRAGIAGARLRRRYPQPHHLVRPTALGNALSAMEDTAGREYGLDAIVAWPRLYAVLGDNVRAMVDDRRDVLDSAGRMTITAGTMFLAAVVLLWDSAGWLALALVPAAIAAVAYAGAVAAAVAYGEAVNSAFDLHRFDLLDALKMPQPRTRDEERAVNRALCDMWRQGVPMTGDYKVDR